MEISKIWRAASFDQAFDFVKNDAKSLYRSRGLIFTGRSDVFEIADAEFEDFTIIWTLIRGSDFDEQSYLDTYAKTEIVEDNLDYNKKNKRWFAVKMYFSDPPDEKLAKYLYDENIILVYCYDPSEASSKATDYARSCEKIDPEIKFLGKMFIREVADDIIGHGSCVWESSRLSVLEPYEYIRTFIGMERDSYGASD